jgi:membrane fusion protein (multidrug efflux system)
MTRGFTTRARLQAADKALADARAQLANAQAEAVKARAALATGAAAPGVNPGVLAGQAQKERAQLDLARTEVRAPVGGKVSSADRLQVGQMMNAGLPALTIVASDRSWVEANFKETDLAHMRVGQPAELTFDAYPDLHLKGHVASIGAGTGSEFSILPAQNANGNWVKVTQRVPVRIAIDAKAARPLIAGLSTHVAIDTSK